MKHTPGIGSCVGQCKLLLCVGLLLLALASAGRNARAQSSSPSRYRGSEILENIKSDLDKHYYDTNLHGMDIDARFKAAAEKIKTAQSNSMIFSIIAQAVIELNDSHTFFLPPDRGFWRIDYGWRMSIMGDTCYVVAVKAGGDADAKGLKVGDVVETIDGARPTRGNFWKIKYSYYTLMPRPNVSLVVHTGAEPARRIDLVVKGFSKQTKEEREQEKKEWEKREAERKKLDKTKDKDQPLYLPRYHEIGDDLIICRMPTFILSERETDDMMKRVGTRKSLILDLRSNGGGYQATLQRLTGYFFDHDTKIADLKGRKETLPLVAKARGEGLFKGRLVVLIDSSSASAAELFARLVQLEKRGTVVGDRSAGAVMQSRRYAHNFNRLLSSDEFTYLAYGMSITTADVIMTDGQSLEHTGVTPDELILPAAADLAARRDPVLARAAALLDVKLDPAQAGKILPREQDTQVEIKTDEDPVPED